MLKFNTLATAAVLAQMVLVPTPGGQYDGGRGGFVVMPQGYIQPRQLPPQFNAPTFQQFQYPSQSPHVPAAQPFQLLPPPR